MEDKKCGWFEPGDIFDSQPKSERCTSGKPAEFRNCGFSNDVYVCEDHKCRCPETAIDKLYKQVDDMLSAGKFTECDEFIDNLDIDSMNTTLLVGALSITSTAKDKLKARDRLVKRVEDRLMILAKDRIEGLMEGLK